MVDGAATQTRRLKGVGTVMVAVFLALFVAMLATNWVVLDVRSLRHEPRHLVMPVPLNMARIPLRMVSRGSFEVPLPRHVEWSVERYLTVLRELQATPEGTVVEVEEDDVVLELSRRGSKLVVETDDGCADVRVSLPFSATLRLLERARQERFEPLEVLDLLASSERGELLAVDAGQASVRITNW